MKHEHTRARWQPSPLSGAIAAAGTTLTQQVSFDNLRPAELGGLIAAFEPARVLPTAGGPLQLHLGGGKPLGLGSCTAAISGLRAWSAASLRRRSRDASRRGRLGRGIPAVLPAAT